MTSALAEKGFKMRFLLITGGRLPLLYHHEEQQALDSCLEAFAEKVKKIKHNGIERLYADGDYVYGRIGKYQFRFGVVKPVTLPANPVLT